MFSLKKAEESVEKTLIPDYATFQVIIHAFQALTLQ